MSPDEPPPREGAGRSAVSGSTETSLKVLRAELAADLEVLRLIGEGTTSRVYLAREPALQRLVAVKVLRPEPASDPIVRQRFEREAQSAARLSHPHVTHIHRVGRLSSGVPLMVMEYIDGRTLKDVLASRGPLPVDEARQILAAVASALAAAHSKRIVHRDVRPDNVFIENRTGRAVLADFGLVALLDTGSSTAARLTATGVRLGDMRYMSPEHIQGEQVTEQSDMYAFGLLAYEILTGEGPYDRSKGEPLLLAHLQSAPRPIRTLRPEVDPETASLIEHLLDKEPNRRPRAREAEAALRAPPGQSGTRPSSESEGEPAGPLAEFMAELRRRRVYQVFLAYGAVAVAILGGAQTVYDAFVLPGWSYQLLVGTVLVGFPLSMVLAWLYDVTSSGIRRTSPVAGAGGNRIRILGWIALGASVLVAVVAGWLLLS